MGGGIAEVCARAGVDVTVFETSEALLNAGRTRLTKSLHRGVSAGRITEVERDGAIGKLRFTTSLTDLADRQLVIEAVIEDEAIKAGIFSQLDRIVTDPDAVLASNTSSIPIMKLAAATGNPGRVLGLHFFNPVPVLPLVELVTTLVTDERGPSSSPPRRSASRWCDVVIGPVSWSTPCWCPTCCRRSGWWNPVSPLSTTSTSPSSPGCPIRWARCDSRT